jgi:hypothetical protein
MFIIMIITCSTVLIEMALSHYCAHIGGSLSTSEHLRGKYERNPQNTKIINTV